MDMKFSQLVYLGWWFFGARVLGRRRPLQSVLFILDKCNLACKHCSVYNAKNPHIMTFEQVREQLEYCYAQGSRFVDFEGGETMLWRDGDRNINDLIRLAREIGFFSATVTTNAQLPFAGLEADSVWVSLDGLGEYHEAIRGKGTFARLERNIKESGHKHLSVNMVVSRVNYENVVQTIEYVRDNPCIESISVNFYTPFPGAGDITLDREVQCEVIDKVIELKRSGYPIMNSVSGLKLMKHNKFKRHCWVTNFVYSDGSRGYCMGDELGICDRCGLCMAGEMNAVFSCKPDTIFAGLKLRM